jgi:DNA polymerase III subunit gamma/tau
VNDSTWATKYRPTKFSEVKGQPEMMFLANLVLRENTYPPVMLFCGPSGVGKTTLARVFAAAANCTQRKKASPCGVCSDCVAIFDGQHPAVVELDAALHSGADDMRRIRDQAYTQAPGKLQVFVIDEVHSASAQAWNVLLKLFEEPPSGVCFALLTSEPHKVPTKIRTRSMRLDFGKVPPAAIRERLEHVAASEGVELPQDVREAILDLCEGSVREAIMMFEQSTASGSGAAQALMCRDVTLEVTHAAMRKDHAEGVELLNTSYDKTGDLHGIMTMWGNAMEKVLLFKHGIPTYVPPTKRTLLTELATGMSETQWAAGMETLAEWSPRVVSRTHLVFVWSQFVRALHGPTVAKPIVVEKPETVEKADIDDLLGEF